MYETMKKYAVKAKSLTDFCEKYHIPGKLTALIEKMIIMRTKQN